MCEQNAGCSRYGRPAFFERASERAPNGIYLKWTGGSYENVALMVVIGVNKDALQLCLYQAGLLFR